MRKKFSFQSAAQPNPRHQRSLVARASSVLGSLPFLGDLSFFGALSFLNGLSIPGTLLFFLVTLETFSCSFAKEFQQMEPPKVVSYVPATTHLTAAEVREIRLRFSTAMESRSTEEAFSLKANTTPLAGTFRWEDGGRTLVFIPLSPLQDRETYVFSLCTAAEDRWGNSLSEEFQRTFHTKEETNRPSVQSTSPASGALVTNLLKPIEFSFSEPMDRESILRSFSLTPSLSGAFTFSPGADSFVWTPLEPYRQGETYQVTLRKEAADTSGNPLLEDYRFSFKVAKTELSILSVTCLSSGAPLNPVLPGTYVDPSLRIEKDESFRIRFSTPLDPDTRDTVVTFHPTTALQMNWNDAGDELLLSFPDPLVWNTVYEFQVLSSTYRFRVNGPLSVPPEVKGIVYIPDTTTDPPAYEKLLFAHNYTFLDSQRAAFDVYISLSPEASIVTSSFLSSFSVEAGNGCMDIRLLRVEESPLSPPPLSLPPFTEGDIPLKVQVFRVHCRITPVFNSGTVTFNIRKDLRDTLGNHLSLPYTLIINKQ